MEWLGDALAESLFSTIITYIQGCISTCYLMVDLLTDNFNELINNTAVQAYLSFVEVFASILFVAGIVFAVSEWAINANEGGTEQIMGTFKYIILGLFTTLGFTTIPVLLMQFTAWCTNALITAGFAAGQQGQFEQTLNENLANDQNTFGGKLLWMIFAVIFFFTVVKVFFSNMKRGGVLLILLLACPFHIFNIPRGHVDAFFSWCKQVLALYITTFAQNFLLALSLMIMGTGSGINAANMCLFIGILLASAEAPQVLQQFGLDSSVKASATQTIFAINGMTNLVGSLGKIK